MLLNTTVGFILPWALGIKFVTKHPKIFILASPIASTLAYAINTFGFHFHYWEVFPTKYEYFSTLPFDLGIYPVYASIMMISIEKKQHSPYRGVLLYSAVLTLLEFIAVLANKVFYYKGWSIILTFFSYLVPLLIVYWYFLLLKHFRIYTGE